MWEFFTLKLTSIVNIILFATMTVGPVKSTSGTCGTAALLTALLRVLSFATFEMLWPKNVINAWAKVWTDSTSEASFHKHRPFLWIHSTSVPRFDSGRMSQEAKLLNPPLFYKTHLQNAPTKSTIAINDLATHLGPWLLTFPSYKSKNWSVSITTWAITTPMHGICI